MKKTVLFLLTLVMMAGVCASAGAESTKACLHFAWDEIEAEQLTVRLTQVDWSGENPPVHNEVEITDYFREGEYLGISFDSSDITFDTISLIYDESSLARVAAAAKWFEVSGLKPDEGLRVFAELGNESATAFATSYRGDSDVTYLGLNPELLYSVAHIMTRNDVRIATLVEFLSLPESEGESVEWDLSGRKLTVTAIELPPISAEMAEFLEVELPVTSK